MEKFKYSPLQIYKSIKDGHDTISDLANYYEISYRKMYYIIDKFEMMDKVKIKKYNRY